MTRGIQFKIHSGYNAGNHHFSKPEEWVRVLAEKIEDDSLRSISQALESQEHRYVMAVEQAFQEIKDDYELDDWKEMMRSITSRVYVSPKGGVTLSVFAGHDFLYSREMGETKTGQQVIKKETGYAVPLERAQKSPYLQNNPYFQKRIAWAERRSELESYKKEPNLERTKVFLGTQINLGGPANKAKRFEQVAKQIAAELDKQDLLGKLHG